MYIVLIKQGAGFWFCGMVPLYDLSRAKEAAARYQTEGFETCIRFVEHPLDVASL